MIVVLQKKNHSIGGGVHMGETAEDAVKREVFEETGVAMILIVWL